MKGGGHVTQDVVGDDEYETIAAVDPQRIGHSAQADKNFLQQIGHVGLVGDTSSEKTAKR